MQFVTDSSGTDAGFVANFTCGEYVESHGPCGGDHFVDTGTIDESSGYDADLDCHWSLSCTNSSLHPTLKFVSFSTEENFDYVNIFDGGSLDSPRIMHASGHGRALRPFFFCTQQVTFKK